MTTQRAAQVSFTKLVVGDLEAMADYYCRVFDLHRGNRVTLENGVGGEPIDEIMLGESADAQYGSLILLCFPNRALVTDDEVILGFTTPDLAKLLDRVRSAGGRVISDVKEMPDHGIRVAFARDPEGHLCELVQQTS